MITGVGKTVEKREPYALLVGTQIGAATVENSMQFPQKIKNRTTYHNIQQFHFRVYIQSR